MLRHPETKHRRFRGVLPLSCATALSLLLPAVAAAGALEVAGTELRLSGAFRAAVVETEGLHHVLRFEPGGVPGQEVVRLVDDTTSAVVDEIPLPPGLAEVVILGGGLADRFRVEGSPPGGLPFRIEGAGGDDVLMGAGGPDLITGGPGDDVLFGDFGTANYDAQTGELTGLASVRLNQAGADRIFGGPGDDVLVGGGFGDALDGEAGSDLLFGDAVTLNGRGPDVTNPRFRALVGTLLYARSDRPAESGGAESGELLVEAIHRPYRDSSGQAPAWASLEIVELHHSFAVEAGLDPGVGPASFGSDHLAGGPGDDVIFGQLGDDTIEGDGSLAAFLAGAPATAFRTATGQLVLIPTFEAASDGDDYVEGGGGDDVVFGGLGQDDLVGGSSSLFSLTDPGLRPDGDDIVFGGAGTRISRNERSDDLISRHARDADVIVGDNGNVMRIVGPDGIDPGGFMAFRYDLAGDPADGWGPYTLIPRGVELVDYTPGGPDRHPELFGSPVVGCGRDIGGGDGLHGEAGDDVVYGGCGIDALYGGAEDDDLVGNWGSDWISGGTGEDGVIGDDGRIFTSRNSSAYGELLYAIDAVPASSIDREIRSRDGSLQATIYPDGALRKTVDLTPFHLDAEAGDPVFEAAFAHDIIFGGLDADTLHGGPGNDAVSGAEALPSSFGQTFDAAGGVTGRIAIDYHHPVNPGDPLRIDSADAAFHRGDSRARVGLTADGTPTSDGSGLPWFLVVDARDVEAPVVDSANDVRSDGDDRIFGDLGTDWLVGGTGRDSIWSGFGNDRADADDDPDTNGGANADPDDHPSYHDLVFGGAGHDTLVANTAGDRLADWTGDGILILRHGRDRFVVPDGVSDSHPTVRDFYVPPFVSDGALAGLLKPDELSFESFLYVLSEAEGADPTRAADESTDPERNGEPLGELGAARPWEE